MSTEPHDRVDCHECGGTLSHAPGCRGDAHCSAPVESIRLRGSWSAIPARWINIRNSEATFTTRKGLVRFADGTEHRALLDFCETDSNEHYGTMVLIEGDFEVSAPDAPSCTESASRMLVSTDHPDFLALLGKRREDVYPYRYRYSGEPCEDHHVGADGWSF